MSIRVIAQVKASDTVEVMIVAPFLSSEDGKHVGYIPTDDMDSSTGIGPAWLRAYSPTLNGLPHARLNRTQYIAAQKAARVVGEAYQRAQAIG